MERARICLGIYYVPDESPADLAKRLTLFARAHRFTPRWAVSQAFDQWEKTATHRPTPGHITKLANVALSRIRDELKARTPAPAPEPLPERTEREKKLATARCELAGFTPKRMQALQRNRMASPGDVSIDPVQAERVPHWSETVDPDGPEMRALRKARDSNPIMAAGRADRERRNGDA